MRARLREPARETRRSAAGPGPRRVRPRRRAPRLEAAPVRSAPSSREWKVAARLPRARLAHEVGRAVAPVHACLVGSGALASARRRRGPTKQPGRRSPPSTRPCRGRSRRRRARAHLQVAVEALARDGLAQLPQRRVPRRGSEMSLSTHAAAPRALAECRRPTRARRSGSGTSASRASRRNVTFLYVPECSQRDAHGSSTASSLARSDRARCDLSAGGQSSIARIRAIAADPMGGEFCLQTIMLALESKHHL